jgi:hypothetical protein
MLRISSSLTSERGGGVAPTIRDKREAIQLKTNTKGVNSQAIACIGLANIMDNLSA